jgi:hypothetical protein
MTQLEAEHTPPFDCPRCGKWQAVPPRLPHVGAETLNEHFGDDPRRAEHRRSRLSHLLRRQQRDGAAIVPLGDLGSWGLDDPLPTPGQQIDSMVLWVGDRLRNYVDAIPVDGPALLAWVGAPITPDEPLAPLSWLLMRDQTKLLLEVVSGIGAEVVRLTIDGWDRHETLTRTATQSRTAFMAMAFNEPDVRSALEACFKPAVKRAGFELRPLTEGQGAGLIDDQMRVALRRARFVISDLSHDNRGAYWEAGFAEGLGKPVIYTCRSDVWNSQSSHFDTNHLVTVIWDPSNLGDAERRLTATVRATLPGDSVMSD